MLGLRSPRLKFQIMFVKGSVLFSSPSSGAIQRYGVRSAVKDTAHYEEPLKSFDKSKA